MMKLIKERFQLSFFFQVDVSIQVNIIERCFDEQHMPLYSREDIKEQYCITSRQLDALKKSGSRIFGCISDGGLSSRGINRTSILLSCLKNIPKNENFSEIMPPSYANKHLDSSMRYKTQFDMDDARFERSAFENIRNFDNSNKNV